MQAKHTVLMLLMLAMLLVGCTGVTGALAATSQDYTSPYGQPGAAGSHACLQDIPLQNTLTLYSNTEGQLFSAPYISRARSQISQNEKRNQILQFVRENPGSRLYDITRSLNTNIGTTRYHLMILGLNHLLVEYQDGDVSRIRYFANKGAYSEGQMKIISLLRREPTSRLLEALAGQPPMTSGKISTASGLSYSDVNRYLRELMAGGIVIKEQSGKDKFQYRIAPDWEAEVVQNLGICRDSIV